LKKKEKSIIIKYKKEEHERGFKELIPIPECKSRHDLQQGAPGLRVMLKRMAGHGLSNKRSHYPHTSPLLVIPCQTLTTISSSDQKVVAGK